MTDKIQYSAVNCRIPTDKYEEAKHIAEVTRQSIASFISQAVEHYMGTVTKAVSEETENKKKIDQYSWELSKNKKG